MTMETWDVLDRRGEKVGTCGKGKVPEGCFHHVAHVWLRNKEGQFLLSKRAEGRHHAGLWETAGGSVLAGEEVEDGARREVKEELGIDVEGLVPFARFFREDQLVTVFVAYYTGQAVCLNERETVDTRLVSEGELRRLHARGEAMPFSYEEALFDWLSAEKD